jgi:redox-sensing transcriptional repressor
MTYKTVSRQTLQRLPLYLNYLRSLPPDGPPNVSATAIAEALGLNDVLVRKDLASVSAGGRPRVGYIIQDLVFSIEQFLGYRDTESAVLVGAGNIGQILLHYKGFTKHGMNIVAAFDKDESVIGESINGKQIFPVDKLSNLCTRMKIRIGIITVPAPSAQEVCNTLVKCGVLAIWNFAPVQLKSPKNVMIYNEDWFSSLDQLLKHLNARLND